MSPPAPAAVAAAVAPSTVDDGTRCGTSVTNADGTAGRPRYETTFLYNEDGAADLDTFEADVIAGFAAPDRFFPSKYFYDDAGSDVFTQMTRSSYYYLTRAENENLATNGAAMLAAAGVCGGAATAGRPVNLIELGAGDGTKTVTLLNAIRDGSSGKDCGGGASPVTYVPIDISWGAMRSLYAAVEGTTGGLSPVRVHGYVADYFDALDTLRDAGWTHGLGGSASDNSPGATLPHNVVVYLGSTVGNVTGAELVSFLAAIRARLNDGDHLLLGYDLLQTPAKHLATYPADRTVGDLFEAILNRMRRELDADISDGALDVEVVFDEADGAVLGRFVSTRDHVLAVGRGARRRDFPLRSGERIHVLLCRKFKRDGMAAAASEAGFELQQTWTDATGRFADSLFRAV